MNDLVCYAPETDIIAAQRADNARTDELFFAWLAQQRVAAGTHSEELSDTALVAEAQGFVQTNPTDTREKWLRNLTAQNLGSSVHQLQTACGVPGIGGKRKKSRMFRRYEWCDILEHFKAKGLVDDDDGTSNQ